MKNTILNILLFWVTTLLAQTTTPVTTPTSGEGNLNNKLLENAVVSRKNLGTQIKTPPTSIKILNNKGASTKITSADGLTDQEKQLSENFVDQAGANRIIKEKCVGEMKEACSGSEVDHKVMGMNPMMVKAIGQAYATFGVMGDGFLPLSAPKADPASKNPDEQTTKEKPTDYCKYIPAATEAIALFTQKNTVQVLSAGGETSQKEQLLKAAKSHDGRAEQAQIQAAGWYGGAACYAANAAAGNFAVDKNLIIKVAAATFLGTIYQSEVANNKEYAKKTRDIANSLPGKGSCNPITENECYCSTPEYANDPNYCQAQIAQRNAPTSFTKVVCTNDELKIDPSCNCVKTNSCFDKFLENQGAATLQIGSAFGTSPFKPIASLARGKLEGGTLNSNSFSGTSAIAKKALNEFMSKIPGDNGPLSLNQKALADAFIEKGLPANVSHLMAQNPPPPSAMNAGLAKANGLGSYIEARNAPGRNNVLQFSGGNGLGVGGKNNEKKDSGINDLLGKLNNKGATNSKILEFAEKAQARASQISKPDTPIFEIISLRYQTSGRRLLQIDSGN